MSPVADCDLKAFYSIVAGDEVGLATLRTFYGCLTAGLAYLHGERVRHRDIKPGNILVKGERVYLADFGISLDWLSSTRSTTTEDSAKTLLYCAPEVAQLKPRNSSSDIWSLGCVFLEITTVLAGFEVEDMRLFFRKTNDDSLFYNNVTVIPDWFDTLRSKSGSEYDAPLEWVTEMLQLETARRPAAGALFKTISRPIPQKIRAQASFCGACCITDTSSEESGSDGSSWAVEHNFMKQNEEAEVSMRKDLSGSRSASDLSSTVSAKVPSAVLSGEITRLHLASQKGQINLVEQRLLANEPIEAVDAEGRTPLHRAAEAGHGEVVYLLLKNGANQHAKDNAGSIPKDLATDPIIIWLLKYGPEHNATDLKGDTFIHSIIRSANSTAAETIEWALGRGYSANSRDCEDNTPLICAVKPGFGHITQLLLHYGARITDKSTDGYPPLVLAARLGHYGVVKVLLDHGAPIEDEGPTRHCPALISVPISIQ
jgi:ankyrin repeat protein